MTFQRQNILSALPPITKYLLLINIALYVITWLLQIKGIDLGFILGIFPPQSPYFKPFQVITHMFMHGSFTHLFFNMFALYMFGSILERVWGSQRFFIYYFVTGFGAAAINMLVQYIRIKHSLIEVNAISPDAYQMILDNGLTTLQLGKNYIGELGNLNLLLHIPTVGASGAIYGLMLAFAMYFPNAPMYIMFIPIPIKAKWLLIGFFIIELGLGFINSESDHVAHFAHLGGMLFGLIFIFIWKQKSINRWN
ncbi:MAG: rhomboid family intramembrane serine protease [Bacteroidales bacterium]|jgi:membrane associated rhomboid family serine protease|nr:rhomboid family intramembrane serine protease [Bacteroidales bacterium]